MLRVFVRGVAPSILRYVSIAAVASCLFLAVPGKADAIWPFGSSSDEPYIAKIDDYVITEDYFARTIRTLHTSEASGELLDRQSSFAIVDFRKHLNDVIDKRLMVFEAQRFELDKELEYRAQLTSFKLNLFLAQLRQEEILDKVNVSDEEVEEYLEKAREEEDALREATADSEGEDASSDAAETDETVGEEVSEEDSEEVSDDEPAPDSHRKKSTARDRVYAEKVVKREAEYFKSLRNKTRVRIYDSALDLIVEKGENLHVDVIDVTVVAKVAGEPIKAFEFMVHVKRARRDFSDKAVLQEALDMLILQKLLDNAALAKNYDEKIEDIGVKIDDYGDKRLVSLFKRKVISPIVKVSDEDILQHYNDNKDKLVRPDSFHISTITVVGEESAHELLEDLRSGADFAYIAKTMSIDPARDLGGEIGWVGKDRFPALVADEISSAKKGDIVGPFKGQYGYFVVMVNDFKVGELVPLEEVRDTIENMIGRESFEDILKEYLLRLRKTVSIEVNEDVLRRFNEGKR